MYLIYYVKKLRLVKFKVIYSKKISIPKHHWFLYFLDFKKKHWMGLWFKPKRLIDLNSSILNPKANFSRTYKYILFILFYFIYY